MPYCPKCKAEYQEGYTMCADCKVPLVEHSDDKEAEEELLVPFFQAEDKKIADKLSAYFNYSDLPSDVSYDEENELYIVSIPPKADKLARQLYQAFYFVERENIANGVYRDDAPENTEDAAGQGGEGSESAAGQGTEEVSGNTAGQGTDEDNEGASVGAKHGDRASGHAAEQAAVPVEEDAQDPEIELYEEETDQGTEASEADGTVLSDQGTAEDELPDEDDPDGMLHAHDDAAYVMKEDSYKDLTSTVWIFLIFGIGGLIFVLLNITGVISVLNGWLPNTIMAIVFLFFLYVAFSTRRKAKAVQSEIAAENQLTSRINEWMKEHLTEEFIQSIYNDTMSEELNYMKLTETVKELLLAQFGPQNTAYLDRLIEDYYNSNLEQPEDESTE